MKTQANRIVATLLALVCLTGFGNTPVTAADIFVQGLTTLPASSAGASVTSFVVDTDGTRYVFGEISGQVTLGPNLSVHGNGTFLARQNQDETWAWAKLFEGSNAHLSDLAVIRSGTHSGLYLAGYYHQNAAGIRYDGQAVPTEDNSDASFLLRVNQDTGTRDPAFLLLMDQGRGGISAHRLRTDGTNLFLGGTLDARVNANDQLPDRPEDSVRFKNPIGSPSALQASNVGDGLWANESDLWVARFDLAERRWKWVFVYGGPRNGDALLDLEVDGSGVYFGGSSSAVTERPNTYGYRLYNQAGTIVAGLDAQGVPVTGPTTLPLFPLPARSPGIRQAVVGRLHFATGNLEQFNQATSPSASDHAIVDLSLTGDAVYLAGAFRQELTDFSNQTTPMPGGAPLRFTGPSAGGGGFVARLRKSNLARERLAELDPSQGFLDEGRSITVAPQGDVFFLGLGEGDYRLRARDQSPENARILLNNPTGFAFALVRLNPDLTPTASTGWPATPEGVAIYNERGFQLARGLGAYQIGNKSELFFAGRVSDGQLRLRVNPDVPETREIIATPAAQIPVLATVDPASPDPVFRATVLEGNLSLRFSTEMLDQTVGPDGALYVVGRYGNGVVFDDNIRLTGQGHYLAKMAPDGHWLWAKALAGTAPVAEFTCVAVSPDRIVVGGNYHRRAESETILFDGQPLHQPEYGGLPVLPGESAVERAEQGFVLWLDHDGTFRKLARIEPVLLLTPSDISSFPSIGGGSPNTAQVTAYFADMNLPAGGKPNAGQPLSQHPNASRYLHASSHIKAIAVNDANLVSVGGLFQRNGESADYHSAIGFRGAEFPSLLPSDRHRARSTKQIFVAHLDPTLTWKWSVSAGGPGRASSAPVALRHNDLAAVAVDDDGITYFAGTARSEWSLADGLLREGPSTRFYDAATRSISDPTPASNAAAVSYCFGRVSGAGAISQLDYDLDPGEANALSYATDLVVTRDSIYLAGTFLGNTVDYRSGSTVGAMAPSTIGNTPVASAWSNPWTRSDDDETDSRNHLAFVWRLDRTVSPPSLTAFAYLKSPTGNSFSYGLSLAADRESQVYLGGICRNTSGLRLHTDRTQAGAGQDLALPVTSASEELPFVLRLDPTLSFTGQSVQPAKSPALPLPDFRYPRAKTAAPPASELGNTLNLTWPVQLALDPTQYRLYLGGNYANGALAFGRNPRTPQGPTLPPEVFGSFITAVDIDPQSTLPFLEQVTVSVESAYGSQLVDRRLRKDFAGTEFAPHEFPIVSFVEPTGGKGKAKVFKGSRVTVRVPYEIYVSEMRPSDNSSIFRDPSTGEPRIQVHDVLWTSSATPRPLSDYLDAGLWPNYPRTRYRCTGFVAGNSVASGTDNEYSVDAANDLTVRFNWTVEHALDVASRVDGATSGNPLLSEDEVRQLGQVTFTAGTGGANALVQGYALPDGQGSESEWRWGRNWIPQGAQVQVIVNATIQELENRTGLGRVRFQFGSYQGRSSAPSAPADFDPGAGFRLASFPLNAPSELLFNWRKQVEITLGPKPRGARYVFVDVLAGPNGTPPRNDWIDPYAGKAEQESAQAWFDAGTRLYVGAVYQPGEGLQLKGWRQGSGHFLEASGSIFQGDSESPELPNSAHNMVLTKQDRVSLQHGKTTVNPAGNGCRETTFGLLIDALSLPTQVTWDYDDVVFRFDVPIGEAFDPAALNRARDQSTPVPADWATTRINACNLPEEILTEHQPTITPEEFLPAGTTGADAFAWDQVAHTLLPLRPGRYNTTFRTRNNRSARIEINTGFYGETILGSDRFAAHPLGLPATRTLPLLGANNTLYHDAFAATPWPQVFRRAHYRYVAGAPSVPLDSDATDGFHFLRLAYSQDHGTDLTPPPNGIPATPRPGSGQVTDNQWSYNAPGGRGVLVFTRSDPTNPSSFPATGDPTRETIMVRVVDARDAGSSSAWTQSGPLIQTVGDAIIGSPLSSPLDTAQLGTGWLWKNGNQLLHNPKVYERDVVRGPIIPVNRRPAPWTPSAGYLHELVVVWYENLAKTTDAGSAANEPSIAWPYQPVHYPSDRLKWPNNPGVIVMASRLGSAGLRPNGQGGWDPQTPFALPRYSDVLVYSQPNREAPGYNPNEEHAILADSIFTHEADAQGQPKPDSIVLKGGSNPPPAAFAFRNGDLNNTASDPSSYTSEPFVLVQYLDASLGEPRMSVYRIETENAIYRFRYPMTAGEPIQAPHPLQQVIGLSDYNDTNPRDNEQTIDGTYFLNGTPGQVAFWIDPKGTAWAISGPTSGEPNPFLFAGFYYPLHSTFWHPTAETGDVQIWLKGLATAGNGPAPFPGAPGKIRFDPQWPDDLPILKVGETLTHAGGEYRADHPNSTLPDGRSVETPGLPGVLGWAAGEIVFDSVNPTMRERWSDPAHYSARLVNPLASREVSLDRNQLPPEVQPASADIAVDGPLWRFKKLSGSLQRRVHYDPLGQAKINDTWITGKLGLRGYLSGRTLGDPQLTAAPDPVYLLEPNILTPRETEELKELYPDNTAWIQAVDALSQLSRDPAQLDPSPGNSQYLTGLGEPFPGSLYYDIDDRKNNAEFGPGLALVPNGALMHPSAGSFVHYLTLVENAHPGNTNLGPVTLHIVKIDSRFRYRGALKTVTSPNVFDEKIVLRHTGDFGANLDDVEYEWWYQPVGSGDSGTPSTSLRWQKLSGETRNEIVLEGNPTLLLGDNQFFARYKHRDAPGWGIPVGEPYPWEWAGAGNSPQIQANGTSRYLPQLVMGWVKRVLDRVNPYEARFSDFRNNDSPATYASMIRQAGPPYRGPVALNPDKNVIEQVGLIELYQTVLNRARDLSINLSQPVGNESIYQALLLAATRLSDLHMLLGNEAYSDAQDPTLGIGTDSVEYGTLAPTVFAFQNQEASLLHEELALLRGTDFTKGYPVQNRLFWNFVKGEGEAAYAVNYAIQDANGDGFIDASDAKLQYPQGHGDAWGHYLSAIQSQYSLIQHPFFQWNARPELYNLLDVVLQVDYLDEAKFARTAAARARAGAEIVQNAYRLAYVADPDGQWQGYTDTDPDRAWGVSEWATRAGQSAVFDWAMANALLPHSTPTEEGLHRLDRQSVTELAEISVNHARIQSQLDSANNGLSPLGLDADAVPFDVDPALFERGSSVAATHFQQIHERARKAGQNALAAFDYANAADQRLRQVETASETLRRQAMQQDRSLRDALIAIYGTPHSGQMGPGKPYPEGYAGPDLMLHMYTEVSDLQSSVPRPPRTLETRLDALRTFITRQLSDDFNDPAVRAQLDRNQANGSKPDEPIRYPFFTVDVFNWDTLTAITSPGDHEAAASVRLPITADGYAFQSPPEWGRRGRTGRLQETIHQMIQAEAELANTLREYDGFLEAIQDKTDLLIARHGTITGVRAIAAQIARKNKNTSESIASDRADSEAISAGIDLLQNTFSSIAEFFPKVVGTATDATSSSRGSVLLGASVLSGIFRWEVLDMNHEIALEESKWAYTVANLEATSRWFEYSLEVRQLLKELEQHIKGEGDIRLRILSRIQSLRMLSDTYRSTLQEGEALVQKRQSKNAEIAAQAQSNRYQDMTLRVTRNDALTRYRQAFDLAAQYTCLAAKAYDYETNLDPAHPGSAQGLLTDVVRERLLGQWIHGEPRLGQGGLAGILARLQENYGVLNGQLGFNNPQQEVGKFSLRHELFRVRPGPKSDERWQKLLQTYRVADLGKVPEFRQYCRPSTTSDAGPQPGLVIPFSTTIEEGLNFFGWPLGAMDHAYDPSQFATKIRSVGVWFDGYDSSQLALTPRVYLVPAGTDMMRVPDSPSLQTRAWHVVDQRIPVPYPTGLADLKNPQWIPAIDSLDGSLSEIRRFSRFRAYPHVSGSMPDDELAWDSRLVGRSVWNTRWLLILPGSSLHADPHAGLDTFIKGPLVGASPSGNGVKDIKLGFRTYAHSGH